jgi:AraC-like DNA-binding protein
MSSEAHATDPPPGPPAEFDTSDPERAHEFLVSAYVDNRMRIRGDRTGFRMRHLHRSAGTISMGLLSHSMAVEHTAEPLGFVLVGRVLRGRFERETAGETLRAGVGDVFVIADPGRPYVARWDDVDLELTRVDPALTAELGAGPGGVAPRLAGLLPVDRGAARRLSSALDWAAEGVLDNPDASASPLVAGSAGRLLAAAVLSTFPHVTEAPAALDAAAASPDLVRRAVEHIEAWAHTDLGPGSLAAAVGSTPRALGLAFRRHLDVTVGEHLRRVRLRRAREELLAADPTLGDTVAAVALRWGFAHPGRFAVAYRREFGESPRRSLHR